MSKKVIHKDVYSRGKFSGMWLGYLCERAVTEKTISCYLWKNVTCKRCLKMKFNKKGE